MVFTSGLSALVRLGAALELAAESRGANMETLSIGHPQNVPARNFYELEIAGRFLLHTVSIAGGEQVMVSASLLDSTAPPQLLLKTRDAESEWDVVFRFISSLELAGVKSLERPIEAITDDPANSWIIC